MNIYYLKNFVNPFEKVAGFRALLMGIVGFVIATFLGYWNNWHYHGLLQFGPNAKLPVWGYAVEILIVWLFISLLFYGGGLIASRSKIRIIDVFGTTSMALLPIIGSTLIGLSPLMRPLLNLDPILSLQEITVYMMQPKMLLAVWISLFSLFFLVWLFVWLWQALKVSCNLKGIPLTVIFLIAVFGGDMLCRFFIHQFRLSVLSH